MSAPLYHTRFVLDKTYFSECFDQTAEQGFTPRLWVKITTFAIIGLILITLDAWSSTPEATAKTYYLGYFFIGLAVIETLSVKYKRTWWLWRQMMSKAAGNPVDLTIDETGITTKSDFVNQQLRWQDVNNIVETDIGFTLTVNQQKNYLSKRSLNDTASTYVRTKIN